MTGYLDGVHAKSRPLLRSPMRWIRAVLFWACSRTPSDISKTPNPALNDVAFGGAMLAAACLFECGLAAGLLMSRELWISW